jgi:hypothetical protein
VTIRWGCLDRWRAAAPTEATQPGFDVIVDSAGTPLTSTTARLTELVAIKNATDASDLPSHAA